MSKSIQTVDPWDIQRLFVHFDGKDGFININKAGDFSLNYWNRQSKEQKEVTVGKLKQIITDWEIFKDLKLSDTYIDQYISSNLTIRASDIRLLYKNVIQKHLSTVEKDFYASSSVGKGDFDRIIPKKDIEGVQSESSSWIFTLFGQNQLSLKIANLFDRVLGNEINKNVRNDFLESLEKQWGEDRVKRILARHAITLKNNHSALRIHDIRKVYASLVQLKEADIQECFEFYKGYRKLKDEEKEDEQAQQDQVKIPTQIFNRFEKHKNSLENTFQDSDLDLSFDQLSGDQKIALIQAVSLNRKEIELCLLGNRIEGVIVGHRGYADIYRFFHSDYQEDKEIAQVMQEIHENRMHFNQKMADLYFHELGTKLLVKKEGSQFVPADLIGRLIPNVDGEWYKITNCTNKWGKFTLFLEPISEGRKGEGVIWQCSTAASWSSSKNLSSNLHNLNPFAPPGYLWGVDFSAEIDFINSHKNVTITGHSLGGSFAQRTLIEYAGSLKKDQKTPTTDIKVLTFDSPGIKQTDDEEVAKNKLLDALKIEIKHYFSYHDVVPFAGETHLGSFKAKDSSHKIAVKARFLYEKGIKNPELNIHPHICYWTRYYSKLKNVKIRVLSPKDLANFGKLHSPFWRGQANNPGGFFDFRALVIDPARRLGGVFAMPILFPVVWIQETGIEYGINIKNKIGRVIRWLIPWVIPTGFKQGS